MYFIVAWLRSSLTIQLWRYTNKSFIQNTACSQQFERLTILYHVHFSGQYFCLCRREVVTSLNGISGLLTQTSFSGDCDSREV